MMIPKAIFTFVNLVCLTVCAYVLVNGFYGTFASSVSSRPLSTQQDDYRVRDTDAVPHPLSAYQAILDRNLFDTRTTNAPSTTTKVDPDSLEETKLNLKLWGTVTGNDNETYAVIEDVKSHEQNLYRTGDAIQTATVKEIFREKVVLTVDGKDEVLQMQDLASGSSASRPGGLPLRAGLQPGGAIRPQRISLRRSYIEQSMTNMGSLMTQVQIRPHMENGVPSGLALSSIKPNSIFRRMGLRNGDVITGVDGREISSVDDALRLVDNLKRASTVSVQLKRRGRQKDIEYHIR
jgi:general secretion pathway protein C